MFSFSWEAFRYIQIPWIFDTIDICINQYFLAFRYKCHEYIQIQIPSGKHTKNNGNSLSSWDNSLCQWPFSIAMWYYRRLLLQWIELLRLTNRASKVSSPRLKAWMWQSGNHYRLSCKLERQKSIKKNKTTLTYIHGIWSFSIFFRAKFGHATWYINHVVISKSTMAMTAVDVRYPH